MPQFDVAITAPERRGLVELARSLLVEDPRLASTDAFGPDVSSGLGLWPNLLIEDHSEIRLFETAGNASYSYRALLLAGDGDLVALDVPRIPAFEEYCRCVLGLGRTELLVPQGNTGFLSLCKRCAADPDLVARAATKARVAGGLNLVPYMATGSAWRLAAEISREAGVAVRVVGPPPGLVQHTNNKLWFAKHVAKALGHQALPLSVPIHSTAVLAHRVSTLSRRFPTIAVKIPDSASSVGNLIFQSPMIAGLSLFELKRLLLTRLAQCGWRGQFPLMATSWESPLVCSPSVQVWVPKLGEADPVVEGIFEQALVGERLEFAGAAPADLPCSIQSRIALDAARIAFFFQNLGYVGRCSFDGILVGDDAERAKLHWIECNGRWGGVSIPMTLINRLTGNWRARPFVVAERTDLAGSAQGFGAFLQHFETELYVAGETSQGLVFLSPSRLQTGSGFEILYVASTAAAASERIQAVASRLTQLIEAKPPTEG